MMNFRQRIGWVGVSLYLLLSVAAAFYVFEVHSFVLERVQSESGSVSAPPPPLTARLPSLPPWVWAGLFLLPYLQIFLFLFSCTRADPHAVGYCLLPVFIVLLCSRHTKPASQRALLIHT
ncbi:lysosomal enzyme trafficking factor [Pholidichthys leucotaenia]